MKNGLDLGGLYGVMLRRIKIELGKKLHSKINLVEQLRPLISLLVLLSEQLLDPINVCQVTSVLPTANYDGTTWFSSPMVDSPFPPLARPTGHVIPYSCYNTILKRLALHRKLFKRSRPRPSTPTSQPISRQPVFCLPTPPDINNNKHHVLCHII